MVKWENAMELLFSMKLDGLVVTVEGCRSISLSLVVGNNMMRLFCYLRRQN